MAIAFRQKTIRFDPTKGQTQREPFSVNFSNRVLRAEAVLKGFKIGYTDKDHHILRTEIDIDIKEVDDNVVNGFVDFLLRDSSGKIDDRFDGWVQIVVIADVAS